MTGLLAFMTDISPYACIAIGVLAAIAIGDKRCRQCFRSRPSSDADSIGGQP